MNTQLTTHSITKIKNGKMIIEEKNQPPDPTTTAKDRKNRMDEVMLVVTVIAMTDFIPRDKNRIALKQMKTIPYETKKQKH